MDGNVHREILSLEIVGGIEWFTIDGQERDCQCARCGSSAEFVRCGNCDEFGYSHHDCGEDCCCCFDDSPNVRCDWCGGTGGSMHCLSSPDWCNEHPMPGRENVESTAMSSEAWSDAL